MTNLTFCGVHISYVEFNLIYRSESQWNFYTRTSI